MKKRLDVKDPNVRKLIDEKYAVKKNSITIESNNIGEQMVHTIEFYKSHSFEEICEIRKKELEKEFREMDQATALRNATILAFKNKGKTNVPKKLIQDVINKITPEAAVNIIANYKKIGFKDRLDEIYKSEKMSYEFFGSIPDEEKIRFSSIYQEMVISQDVFKAREESIKETAKELELDLPLCLENKDTVSAESSRIISMSEADEKERTFINKVKESCNKAADFFEEKENLISLSFGSSVAVGACAFVNYLNHSIQLNPAIASAVFASSLTMATCMALFNSYDIKCYFEDKKTISEAKELGLIDLLVNMSIATKAYNDEAEKYKSDYIRQMEGGKNGLHQ